MANIRKNKDKNLPVRNIKSRNKEKLPEDVFKILPESNGLRLVDGKKHCYYLDADGKVSNNDYYLLATCYNAGFAFVQKNENGPLKRRDLLGNLSQEETYLGKRVCDYVEGRIKAERLLSDEKLPFDEKLVPFIVATEERKLPKYRTKSRADRAKAELHSKIDPIIKKYENTKDEREQIMDDPQKSSLSR